MAGTEAEMDIEFSHLVWQLSENRSQLPVTQSCAMHGSPPGRLAASPASFPVSLTFLPKQCQHLQPHWILFSRSFSIFLWFGVFLMLVSQLFLSSSFTRLGAPNELDLLISLNSSKNNSINKTKPYSLLSAQGIIFLHLSAEALPCLGRSFDSVHGWLPCRLLGFCEVSTMSLNFSWEYIIIFVDRPRDPHICNNWIFSTKIKSITIHRR